MHREDTTLTVTMRGMFDGAPLTSLEWKGRPCWVAGEIDRALGLPDNLSGSRWAARSKDYRDGADGEQIAGPALDALKAAGLAGTNAPVVTVFYESGATLYLMASRAEKARAFRWHLVDVVLPQLRAGRFPVSATAVDLVKEAVRLDPSVLARSCSPAWLREQAKCGRQFESEADNRLAAQLREGDRHDRAELREIRRSRRSRRPRRTTLW